MDITAYARHLRISPRKVRKVADLIRARSARIAQTQLLHLPYRSARPLAKLIDSAVHNAKNNFGIEEADLYIKKITIDGGPVGKRFRPGAAGRVSPYTKRTSHVTLVLSSHESGKVKTPRTQSATHISQTTHGEALKEKETKREIKKSSTFAKSDARPLPAKKQTGARRFFQRKAMGS